jgi:hypothetical protein
MVPRLFAARLRPIAALAALHAAFACGGDEPDQASNAAVPDDGIPLTYEPCPMERRVGGFSIDLAPDYTSVAGQVYDGVAPRDVPVAVASEAGCTLYAAPVTQCNPECNAVSQVCAEGNLCQPRPAARDLGKVTVRGLLVPLVMEANRVTKAYANAASSRLPHPGFSPGARLRLSTSGGDYTPIELRGWGVSPLQGVPNPVAVRAGEGVSISWQAPADAGPARVHLNLNVNHHGSTNNWLECDVEDSGSAQLPSALVDALLERGRSGYPTLTVSRRSVSSAQIEPGCVELLVSSEIVSDAMRDGLTSCSRATDCASGQSCGPEFYCL